MPTATKFMTDGVGSGFIRCLNKTDVTDSPDGGEYDYWTTLSGVNKDNVDGFTDEELAAKIQESLGLAMKMYWNLNKVEGSASSTLNTETVEVTEATVGIFNFTPDSSDSETVIPKDRVCSKSLLGREVIELSDGPAGNSNDIQTSTNAGLFARMYDGVVTDEDNFVGYGLGSSAFRAFGRVINVDSATVILESVLNESVLSNHDAAYVEVSGVHFVCEAIGDTRDASLLTATSSGSGFLDGVPSTWSSTATLTSFDFYTY